MFRLASGPAPSELLIRTPFNVNAADTTNTDQLQAGGSLGLNLTGSGYTVGVWDAGLIRNTHQEFGSRVTLADSGSFHYHSTHVGGTIGASGVVASAQGMATQVALRSREWTNDLAEMNSDAGLIDVSNHSYGYVTGWAIYPASSYGFSTPSGSVDVWFEDRYLYASEDTDFRQVQQRQLAISTSCSHDNPDLLSVWSAGNDRDDAYSNASGNGTYVAWFSGDPGGIGWSGAGWYLVSTSSFPAPGGDGNAGTGYDSIGGAASCQEFPGGRGRQRRPQRSLYLGPDRHHGLLQLWADGRRPDQAGRCRQRGGSVLDRLRFGYRLHDHVRARRCRRPTWPARRCC